MIEYVNQFFTLVGALVIVFTASFAAAKGWSLGRKPTTINVNLKEM